MAFKASLAKRLLELVGNSLQFEVRDIDCVGEVVRRVLLVDLRRIVFEVLETAVRADQG